MPGRLLAAAATVALLAGCGILPGAPSGPVGPRSCPALIELPEAAPEARPAEPADTLRDLLHWRFDISTYATALERQARAREAQIEKHNRGL